MTSSDNATKLHSPSLSILLLAMSVFVIGTAEFVVMGILPDVANDLDITIPKAGWLITAYALGMAFGGPLMAIVASKFPRKRALVGLMGYFAVCSVLCAWAPTYETLMIARILGASGQGAFFGIGAVMAASVVPVNRQASAVALMLTGLTLANVLGVPLGTALGHWLGWRAPFVAIALLSIIGMLGLSLALPSSHKEVAVNMKAELRALRDRRIWITLASTVLFTSAIFPVFTYIAPILEDVTGLSSSGVAVTLLAVGLGMTLGSYIGGRISDWSIERALIGIPIAIAAASLALHWSSRNFVAAEINWFIWGMVTFSALPTLQMSVMRFGSKAPNLVSTLNISALNIGVALGASIGGALLEQGYTLTDIPFAAAVISVVALVGVLLSGLVLRRLPYTEVAAE